MRSSTHVSQPGKPLHARPACSAAATSALCKPLVAAVRDKIEAAEEHFMHPHTFVGPNPDEGSEGAK